ncbi:hypothetical protein N2152v2_004930 [Parachlorella kessleri]
MSGTYHREEVHKEVHTSGTDYGTATTHATTGEGIVDKTSRKLHEAKEGLKDMVNSAKAGAHNAQQQAHTAGTTGSEYHYEKKNADGSYVKETKGPDGSYEYKEKKSY